MKKDFLEIGKIVGTHGVRGMVRIQPWCDSGDFLTDFKYFYLEMGAKKLSVNKITPHGNVVIAAFDGIFTIENAEKLRNKILYIKHDDINLPEGRYFVSEIIGAKVFDNATGKLLGILKDVTQTGANDVWHVENGGKEYLVPAIPDVIADVDVNSDTVKINVLKGIFDDEN